jgi:hypothetical protein
LEVHIYEATELALEGVRSHPWLTSLYDQKCRYYDFKKNPELIPQVLEDFLPWARYQAIQDFYSYLAWLNGPDSELESDDCAFTGAEKNLSPNITSKKLQVSGRLMLLFRSLACNCENTNSEWLFKCFWFYLERVEPELELGVIGLSRTTTEFIALNRREGKSLVLNFWAWGDSEAEAMDNLQILIRGLKQASSEVCTDIRSVSQQR